MFWLKIPSRGSKKPPKGFKGGKLLPQLYFYNTDPKGADGLERRDSGAERRGGDRLVGYPLLLTSAVSQVWVLRN